MTRAKLDRHARRKGAPRRKKLVANHRLGATPALAAAGRRRVPPVELIAGPHRVEQRASVEPRSFFYEEVQVSRTPFIFLRGTSEYFSFQDSTVFIFLEFRLES